ncbi:hypothetical protein KEM56_000336 [Ascosphaera pollenicola]|nr:hypothetical protein KEM56_000336 [Ascosphaera pollenicola]
MIINGEKWACNACIRGHRVSSCSHHDRPLSHVNKKGRPVSQCQHCRGLRRSKSSHALAQQLRRLKTDFQSALRYNRNLSTTRTPYGSSPHDQTLPRRRETERCTHAAYLRIRPMTVPWIVRNLAMTNTSSTLPDSRSPD